MATLYQVYCVVCFAKDTYTCGPLLYTYGPLVYTCGPTHVGLLCTHVGHFCTHVGLLCTHVGLFCGKRDDTIHPYEVSCVVCFAKDTYTCGPFVYTCGPLLYTCGPLLYTCGGPLLYTCGPLLYTCGPLLWQKRRHNRPNVLRKGYLHMWASCVCVYIYTYICTHTNRGDPISGLFCRIWCKRDLHMWTAFACVYIYVYIHVYMYEYARAVAILYNVQCASSPLSVTIHAF